MTSGERIYQASVRTLSVIFIGLGAAILISTLSRGGGPLSLGVLLGIAFLVVGILRGWRGGGGGRRDRTRGDSPS